MTKGDQVWAMTNEELAEYFAAKETALTDLIFQSVQEQMKKKEMFHKMGGERMSDVCKWLADEVCVNVDCPYVADFCPSTEHPRCCVHFEEQEETTDEGNA